MEKMVEILQNILILYYIHNKFCKTYQVFLHSSEFHDHSVQEPKACDFIFPMG